MEIAFAVQKFHQWDLTLRLIADVDQDVSGRDTDNSAFDDTSRFDRAQALLKKRRKFIGAARRRAFYLFFLLSHGGNSDLV